MRNVWRMTMEIGARKVLIPEFHVGDRLQKAREAVDLSQQELADEIGVARRSITRWETTGSVRRSTILIYSMRTGVPVEWIEHGTVPDGPKLPGLDSNQEPIG